VAITQRVMADRQEQAGGQGEELEIMRVVDRCEADILALIDIDWPSASKSSTFAELFPNWLTFKARSIVRARRAVVSSRRVKIAKKLYPAIGKIEALLKKGGNVGPYLHNGIREQPRFEAADRLFLDWGMHHFHLGDIDAQGLAGRTRAVLFAYIEDLTVYMLDVKDHGSTNPLVWVDKDLVRALVETAPEIAERYELKNVVGLSQQYTDADHSRLRKADINVIIEVDGKFYAPFGGGQSTASTRIASQRIADQFSLSVAELRGKFDRGEIQVPGKIAAPFTEPVAVLRAEFRDGKIRIFEESSGEVCLLSNTIS
jgi:hypothetical protein